MSKHSFFKPTPLYKEFFILDLIEKEDKITQRMMSDYLGVSVSMINSYLDKYEEMKYIERKYVNSKIVTYNITAKGIERKKVLNIRYLEASYLIFQGAKNNIDTFIKQVVDKGFKRILLYGGGEVAEIFLQTLQTNKSIPLDVVAVIDDDIKKQGNKIIDTIVISNSDINQYQHDGILIASYIHRENIYKRLVELDYDKEKILQFFN